MKYKKNYKVNITLISILVIASIALLSKLNVLHNNGQLFKDKTLEKQRLVGECMFPINENGETYGTDIYDNDEGAEPDLIAAIGDDGTSGYVRSSDLNGPEHSTPEEALAYQKNNSGGRIINLYEKDGKTIIGTFKVGGTN